ncbi:TIR domain-containing protein [Bacteroidales bacterium OttesenSCG-928-A17]|nr:TIR domain-containing protein [Bacteroidales bacterium OttesenSCG-928-A17]
MARKTFISYKYSEAQNLRDKIIRALGNDAQYYQGETSDSPDLTDTSTDSIKNNLKDMMYNTSVTIVIISPSMVKSKWIDWEIEYCLKEISRKDRKSYTNGVIGVIMNVNGSADWLKIHSSNIHGSPTVSYKQEFLYPIIYKNRYNSTPALKHCHECNTYDFMNGSYITLVDENDFLANPSYYIENAFDKSENTSKFDLTKQR